MFSSTMTRRLGGTAAAVLIAAGSLGVGAASASAVAPSAERVSAVSSGSYSTTVDTNGLRLRYGPGTRYAVKGLLYSGDKVTVTKCRGSWAYLGLRAKSRTGMKKGTHGWVSWYYLMPTQDPDNPVRVPASC